MTGTIIRVFAEKNFGFIKAEEDGKEYFFHTSDFNGFFEDLVTDVMNGLKVKVEFEGFMATKGPRARQISRVDGGVV